MIDKHAEIRRCTYRWINEFFSHIPDWIILGWDDTVEMDPRWEFIGVNENYNEETDDECNKYHHVNPPMWSTYFLPYNQLDTRWFDNHREEVMDLGFTIICHDGDFMGLGINAAGYDFYEAYWIPLYKLRGLQWHDREK